MKFSIDTKIEITFSEEQIKEHLKKVVQDEMPNVTVNDIILQIKRNPTNISASVDASIEGYENTPVEKEELLELETETTEKTEVGEVTTEGDSETVTDYLNLD